MTFFKHVTVMRDFKNEKDLVLVSSLISATLLASQTWKMCHTCFKYTHKFPIALLLTN